MLIHEKLRLTRVSKGFTQEQVAEKLSMSINGYANIERGETDVTISKLKRIANILEISLEDLIGVNSNKTVFTIHNPKHVNLPASEDLQLKYELEKQQLIIEMKNKEIELLQQQIEQLKEINALLKAKTS